MYIYIYIYNVNIYMYMYISGVQRLSSYLVARCKEMTATKNTLCVVTV